jgi:hypothetical protein
VPGHCERRVCRHGFSGRIEARHFFRQAEVQDLRAMCGHHDVRGFEVPMDEAHGMRRGQRRRDLRGQLAHVVNRERAPGQHFVQRLAVDVLHDEVGGAVVLRDVVEGADVRMVERRDRSRFALESTLESCVSCVLRPDELDRDDAAEPAVAGPEHTAHAAVAELPLELVGSDAIAGTRRLLRDRGHGARCCYN